MVSVGDSSSRMYEMTNLITLDDAIEAVRLIYLCNCRDQYLNVFWKLKAKTRKRHTLKYFVLVMQLV